MTRQARNITIAAAAVWLVPRLLGAPVPPSAGLAVTVAVMAVALVGVHDRIFGGAR